MPKGIWNRPREPLSRIHKLAISQSLKGRNLTDEHKRQIGLSNSGQKLSNETKEKISASLRGHYYGGGFQKGRITSTEHRARISKANIGKHSFPKTEEQKRKISQTAIARGVSREEKNPNWRGGIGYLPYPFEFNGELKETIRDRDNHICQLCGIPECECDRRLLIHHIDYDKTNCARDNLISLCNRCHGRVHYNRDYWQSYFSASSEVVYA